MNLRLGSIRKCRIPRAPPGFPILYFCPEPHFAASFPQVDQRPRHIGIAALVKRHCVSLSEAEHVGHALGIDQFFYVYFSTHRPFSLQVLTVEGQ